MAVGGGGRCRRNVAASPQRWKSHAKQSLMFSVLNACVAGGSAAILWSCTGLPFILRLVPRSIAFPLAPALGWAVQSAGAMLLFSFFGMSRLAVTATMAAGAVAGVLASRTAWQGAFEDELPRVPPWALAIAGLIALAPVVAIVPEVSAEGVSLAGPIFDHSKIAIIDEIMRLGVPAGNPFFGEMDGNERLSYYYLWHFSAAELGVLAGINGWEADAGLTWFTAFASLWLMMGLAVRLGERAAAAPWILVLAATASIRPILAFFIDRDHIDSLIEPATGFGGWLFQVTWAPQHVASASCVMLAALILSLLVRLQSVLGLVTLVLVVVAGFESSAWVGGITFVIAAVGICWLLLSNMTPPCRASYIGRLAIAAVLVIVLAAPSLYDQYMMELARGGAPIAIMPYRVLGDAISEPLRQILDLPAFWLLFLVVEFPAFYAAGAVMLVSLVPDRTLSLDRRLAVLAFAALTMSSLGTAGLLVSVIGNNNDLGWRAVLPGAMLLMVFTAIGLARWRSNGNTLAFTAALIGMALGLPAGLEAGYGYVVDRPQPSKPFAASIEMWQHVRLHSNEIDRVVNNPSFLRDVTRWPVNISWALLSNRRSCYAGRELAFPFAPLSRNRRDQIDAQFNRVFEGDAEADDLRQLALQFRCRLAVLTPQDGAWNRDPFAASGLYRLVESRPNWRIYKSVP